MINRIADEPFTPEGLSPCTQFIRQWSTVQVVPFKQRSSCPGCPPSGWLYRAFVLPPAPFYVDFPPIGCTATTQFLSLHLHVSSPIRLMLISPRSIMQTALGIVMRSLALRVIRCCSSRFFLLIDPILVHQLPHQVQDTSSVPCQTAGSQHAS